MTREVDRLALIPCRSSRPGGATRSPGPVVRQNSRAPLLPHRGVAAVHTLGRKRAARQIACPEVDDQLGLTRMTAWLNERRR